MKNVKKTNALRILDAHHIEYTAHTYEGTGGLSGVAVANELGEDIACVYKTLVTVSKEGHFVFDVPVAKELDLKKAAVAVGVKKLEMLKQKDLFALTGYVHGGCSPLGMKSQLPTVLDSSAQSHERIFVSGGRIGLQIHIAPEDLVRLIGATYADITKQD
ncbi:Cys-tRNA(Pro) deacylase [Peptoniphilus equinus]|uniref:Cys-tRNA(Pro)/Cys-tRNA(Cys) deacylase n=1 Tax=Peptoniphilus equinus TaxID=3016343 RepID=A0ABY7QTK1_9FIRM|nr:Cys-tRNA(Pro) deacylase [Peptoniphilus equinus]WBW49681.1 Cys-tRNA(Pro) deacylase [Peptoniphilus equinus]